MATRAFDVESILGLASGGLSSGSLTAAAMETAGRAALRLSGSTHALLVLAGPEDTVDGQVPGTLEMITM